MISKLVYRKNRCLIDLFNIFTNDLFFCIIKSKIFMLADDNALYRWYKDFDYMFLNPKSDL